MVGENIYIDTDLVQQNKSVRNRTTAVSTIGRDMEKHLDTGQLLGISGPQLAAQYPRLFHLAEDGAWANIQRHGLLSTTALLDLFEISGARRNELERHHRPDRVTLQHPRWGAVVL